MGLAMSEISAGLRRVISVITARTGLHYYTDKPALLEKIIDARMKALGCRGYVDYLARLDDATLGEAEWRELESAVTIGETFFFRYAEQFRALETTILPELLTRLRGVRVLRIWSVGCSNGAEPYSVAIVLRQLLKQRGELGWTIEILGTDISTRALEQARGGEFGWWALRDLTERQRAEWFVPVVEGRTWRLKDCYRQMVRFRHANIMDLPRGRGPAGPFDLILCRNVLIYFDPLQVTRLVQAMAERIAGDGWMLVGHSEPIGPFESVMQPVRLPGTMAFRAKGSTAVAPVALPARQKAESFRYGAPRLPSRRPVALPALPEAATADPGREAGILRTIRQLADGGATRRAVTVCHEYLRRSPMAVGVYFMLGVLLLALGEHEGAVEGFRRVIYLRRGHVMARCYLAHLLERTGAADDARRLRAQARELARSLAAGHVLEGGGGLTAGGLLRLLQDKENHDASLLSTLSDIASGMS
ncbi:protein-glutamate O-methyltransferase CheR [Komagataeibacter pomaceti]|uniref:protein-glutamate O-methyltransferase n=2 Tax=Novacetimonas pomaceti TaxID=2021998 RepID=A0A318QP43_9PROT|nr:protein-glutamate O-methyltransferase CheR [Novacetimonas pomaceti]PYD47697.1 methyltransferase [Novacetimonas pomaceti]PYD76969.1 hypothetical protein CFR71_01050 [Novacetimonas pomaceti]